MNALIQILALTEGLDGPKSFFQFYHGDRKIFALKEVMVNIYIGWKEKEKEKEKGVLANILK